MRTDDLALVQGLAHTRRTLHEWNRSPAPIYAWMRFSLAIGGALLLCIWAISTLMTPDPTPLAFPGFNAPATISDSAGVLARNLLVLALHAFACVAGFIAGSSLPTAAERHSGLWRKVHDHAGPLAIAFVSAATAFSLATQAYVLGSTASTLAAQLKIGPGVLLIALSLHALPELTALFLPLAAWLIASRRGQWHELLAATLVTVALALPVLVLSAAVEVFVSPRLLGLLTG